MQWSLFSLELPDMTTLRPVAVALAVLAAVLLFGLKWSGLRTFGLCAAWRPGRPACRSAERHLLPASAVRGRCRARVTPVPAARSTAPR
ncbi:hypothetical protein [Geodermatophilus ruber]|uniref:Uncharacterized protein n=1 Tax=Geodermatophilus ruber TaxID=504800 RepID=A0A1I4CIF7_9ACTN|nr:hypothetical protein [Geodermatophilus ruber]SFK79866.1 hypothetical protein SAMN04488085_103481 [Geodermatophilus ruber]